MPLNVFCVERESWVDGYLNKLELSQETKIAALFYGQHLQTHCFFFIRSMYVDYLMTIFAIYNTPHHPSMYVWLTGYKLGGIWNSDLDLDFITLILYATHPLGCICQFISNVCLTFWVNINSKNVEIVARNSSSRAKLLYKIHPEYLMDISASFFLKITTSMCDLLSTN